MVWTGFQLVHMPSTSFRFCYQNQNHACHRHFSLSSLCRSKAHREASPWDDDLQEKLGICIYGLKQAVRMFLYHLYSTLKSLGFVPTCSDTSVCIYDCDDARG